MYFPTDKRSWAEKLTILFLSLYLAGLCYFQFLYRPAKEEIERCETRRMAMIDELAQVQQRVAQLRKMQRELDELEQIGFTSRMPSYNSVEDETSFLNDILTKAEQYSITFSSPSRKNDQVRRNVTLRFTAKNYDVAGQILTGLAESDFRCLLGDLRYTSAENGTVSVNAGVTFFETMAGETMDSNLNS